MDREWIPLYLQNFLGASGLLDDLQTLGRVGESLRGHLRAAASDYLVDPSEAEQLAGRLAEAIANSRETESTVVRGIVDDYVEDNEVDAATGHLSAILQSSDPGALILEWAQDAQLGIDRQRRALYQPLDEAEAMVAADLSEGYAEMLRANGVVTARLEASAKVKESQERLLDALGVSDPAGSLRERLSSISSTVSEALAAGSSLLADKDSLQASGQRVVDTLSQISKSNDKE